MVEIETRTTDDKEHSSKIAGLLALPPKGDAANAVERAPGTTGGNVPVGRSDIAPTDAGFDHPTTAIT